MSYEWAVNKLKLTRAIERAGKETEKPTEDDVKKAYIALGGLIVAGSVKGSVSHSGGNEPDVDQNFIRDMQKDDGISIVRERKPVRAKQPKEEDAE